MIIRSRIVVTMEGEPIENGAVAIAGNKIAGVGPFEEVRANYGGDLLDLGEQILLPGLINTHCHLDYTMLRGKIPVQQTFTDWVRAINVCKAALKADDYLTAITTGLAEAQSFGTTTLVNLEAFPPLLWRLPPPQPRLWWCAEMIDVRAAVSAEKVSADLRDWFHSLPGALGGTGLAPHALYTASTKLFSDASAMGRQHDLLLTTHLAESREEMEMFRDANGPLYNFLRDIGRPMDDCGGATPVSRLIGSHAIDRRWIVAHLNEITEDDFDLLARNANFHVAHCPSSHAYFRHSPFALRRLQRLGFNVCLGTDSLASSSSLSLFAEMRTLIREEPSVSPREAVTMATVNGACAIGQANSLGRISAGFSADLIAIDCPKIEGTVFDTIVGFEGTVRWMMVDGRIMNLG